MHASMYNNFGKDLGKAFRCCVAAVIVFILVAFVAGGGIAYLIWG